MPPTSVNLFEEGAEIVSFKIVNGGVFDREGLVDYMVKKPAQHSGCSGCRNIRDVESDLKAVCNFLEARKFSITHLSPANCG
jgi:5-oxoprolinase (ATP-hydrolysing)